MVKLLVVGKLQFMGQQSFTEKKKKNKLNNQGWGGGGGMRKGSGFSFWVDPWVVSYSRLS